VVEKTPHQNEFSPLANTKPVFGLSESLEQWEWPAGIFIVRMLHRKSNKSNSFKPIVEPDSCGINASAVKCGRKK
jgi:hypothetical protein